MKISYGSVIEITQMIEEWDIAYGDAHSSIAYFNCVFQFQMLVMKKEKKSFWSKTFGKPLLITT